MPKFQPKMEIERIQNLITNFDWSIIKQEITETDITLTISRPKPPSVEVASAGAS